MLACAGKSDGHCKTALFLLNHPKGGGENILVKTLWHWNTLMWAAIGGQLPVIENLLLFIQKDKINNDGILHLNEKNKQGDSALMIAVENGHLDVVSFLISEGAERNDTRALKLAIEKGFVSIAVLFLRLLLVEITTRKNKNNHIIDVVSYNILFLSEDSRNRLAFSYSNIFSDSLDDICLHAGEFDLFFDMLIDFFRLFPTPSLLLNNRLKYFFLGLRASAHRTNTDGRNTDLDYLDKFVRLSIVIKNASVSHPLESKDLNERYNQLMKTIHECLSSDSMYNSNIIYSTLCFKTMFQDKNAIYENDAVERAQAFFDGPLQLATTNSIKGFFSTGNMSNYINNLFWGFLKYEDSVEYVCKSKAFYFSHIIKQFVSISNELEDLLHFQLQYLNGRYSPSGFLLILFLSLSKFFFSLFFL
jgi:hypothetical protein